MKYDRLRELELYAKDKDFVSLDELCQVFQKSKNTIRRDVAQLVGDGRLEKVYGGVRALSKASVEAFSERVVHQAAEKQWIGRQAAQFVSDGDIIFLDAGTTTVNMIPHLSQLHDVTILTNNLYVILACMEQPNLNVITLGGQLNLETASFSSHYCALDNLKKFNIRKAFMTATGLSIEQGATNTSSAEATIKKNVMDRSEERFLLADDSKFGHSALLTYAPLDAFRCVITNAQPPEEYIAYFREREIDVVV
ncbi:MAG: DeoR/GlpR family DNA-binding transcription regulator [Oscillibacter sp.]